MSDARDIEPSGLKRDSLWVFIVPAVIGVILAVGGAAYYYFGPRLRDIAGDVAKPTARRDLVDLTVGARTFRIPMNYTVFPRDRRPGEKSEVHLYGAIPDLDPYGDAPRRVFFDEDPSADLVRFWIKTRALRVEESRLIAMALERALDDLGPAQDAPDLRRHRVGSQTPGPWRGYAGDDLFIGRTDIGAVLIRCEPPAAEPNDPPAQCRRDALWSETVDYGYAFDRRRLPNWRSIDARVAELIAVFDGAGPETSPPAAPNAAGASSRP